MPTAPTVEVVTAYLDSIGTDTSDTEQLDQAYAAEVAAQRRVVRFPIDADPEAPADYPADLAEALCRRVARNLWMRGVPSGLQSGGEGSFTVRVGADPEVRRLEAPWRKLVSG